MRRKRWIYVTNVAMLFFVFLFLHSTIVHATEQTHIQIGFQQDESIYSKEKISQGIMYPSSLSSCNKNDRKKLLPKTGEINNLFFIFLGSIWISTFILFNIFLKKEEK